MKQTLKLWSLKGHLDSCCPAYCGTFAAKVVACNRGAAKALEAVRLENDQRKREKEAHVAARHQAVMTQLAPIFPMLKLLPNGLYDLCGHECNVRFDPSKPGYWYWLEPICNMIGYSGSEYRVWDLLSFGHYLKWLEAQKPPAPLSITYHEEPGIVPRWLRRLFGCD